MYVWLAKLRAMAGQIFNVATMKDSRYTLPPVPPPETLGGQFYMENQTRVKLQWVGAV